MRVQGGILCARRNADRFLWSEDRDIVPIETDEGLKMDVARAQFQKQAAVTMVLAYCGYCAILGLRSWGEWGWPDICWSHYLKQCGDSGVILHAVSSF